MNLESILLEVGMNFSLFRIELSPAKSTVTVIALI